MRMPPELRGPGLCRPGCRLRSGDHAPSSAGLFLLIGISNGKGELESRAGFALRLHPYPPAVTFDNFLADGQADAVARVFGAGVQALKDHKNLLRVLRRNPDSVVAHAE